MKKGSCAMKLLKELRYIFPRKQRLLFLLLFFLQLIATVFDFLGVSLILPFINVLLNPAASHSTSWYRWVAALLGTQTEEAVLLFITAVIMAVYIIKNLYSLLMINLNARFVSANKIRMGARMVRCYMNKPYTFHLQRNTAEIVRNINSDVNGAFSVVSTLLALISDVLIVAVLVVFLVAVDVWMTLAISAALLICSDIVSRTLISPTVLPIGALTSFLGAPLFLYLIVKRGGVK